MLKGIVPGQLDCIGEIARRIYNQTMPLLERDLIFFRDMALVLRFLFSAKISFRRKKAMLICYHELIPRMLRSYYIQATIQDQIISQRES